jgi:hypothetical protein
MRIRMLSSLAPGTGIQDGKNGSGILDKHPGPATLFESYKIDASTCFIFAVPGSAGGTPPGRLQRCPHIDLRHLNRNINLHEDLHAQHIGLTLPFQSSHKEIRDSDFHGIGNKESFKTGL